MFIYRIFGLTLHSQIETETGTAGEQPVRDIFDQLTKSQKKRVVLNQSFLTFLEVVYALKNPSINFILRSFANPL